MHRRGRGVKRTFTFRTGHVGTGCDSGSKAPSSANVVPTEYAEVVVFITELGGTTLLMFLLAVLFLVRGSPPGALVINYAVAGLALLLSLKAVFELPRPPADAMLLPLEARGVRLERSRVRGGGRLRRARLGVRSGRRLAGRRRCKHARRRGLALARSPSGSTSGRRDRRRGPPESPSSGS